jgi:hypothetical protein
VAEELVAEKLATQIKVVAVVAEAVLVKQELLVDLE